MERINKMLFTCSGSSDVRRSLITKPAALNCLSTHADRAGIQWIWRATFDNFGNTVWCVRQKSNGLSVKVWFISINCQITTQLVNFWCMKRIIFTSRTVAFIEYLVWIVVIFILLKEGLLNLFFLYWCNNATLANSIRRLGLNSFFLMFNKMKKRKNNSKRGKIDYCFKCRFLLLIFMD